MPQNRFPLARERQVFPTRNYPYRAREARDAEMGDPVAFNPVNPNTLYRFVLGIDQAPKPMSKEELGELRDPLGLLLRSGSRFPLTLRNLLKEFDSRAELTRQLVFLVADGGHVPWTPETDALERAFRFVVARAAQEFTVLISSSVSADSAEDGAFLQIIGWDSELGRYNYYERRQGTFFWAGNSLHALSGLTRGKGPFDSHVNGSLVMKELRAPWIHWHAPQAGINAEAFAPNDPLLQDVLFKSRVTAERLETDVVKPGIRRWNESRVKRVLLNPQSWNDTGDFMRQIVTETTVNLVTAGLRSELVRDEIRLDLPASFFINRDTLFDTLGLEPDDPELTRISISGAFYRACLKKYNVHRTDGNIQIEGDSHFAFLTPEPAFEDTELADRLVMNGLLSRRFLACLTMVDFPNPVFSTRRLALLQYVPTSVQGSNLANGLENAFVANIAASPAASLSDTPEREFLSNWAQVDFEPAFRTRITTYFAALQQASEDPDAVDGWFRLAESRRRLFRRRPLAEFSLTTPRTNIPEDAPPLGMKANGGVSVVN